MKLKLLISSALLLLLVGCSSSPYTYYVDPTPLKEGVTKYELKSVKVNLTNQENIHEEADVSSEEELTQYFKDGLTKYMEELDVLAKTPNSADASISIVIDYFRTFHVGGKALRKPEISHYVVVEKGGEKLASFGVSNYTTRYTYLKDLAVTAEILAFQWDKNDEKEVDVDLISKILAEDISGLGN